MDKDSDKVVLETKGEVEEQEKRKGINKDKSYQGLCLFIPPPLLLVHSTYPIWENIGLSLDFSQ